MRITLLMLLVALGMAGCASPPALTQKQKDKQTWLVTHGFRNVDGLLYSREYASLDSVRSDFTLGLDDIRGAPKTPLLGPQVLVFVSHEMFFTIRGVHEEKYLGPQTGCVVTASLEEEPIQPSEPTSGLAPGRGSP